MNLPTRVCPRSLAIAFAALSALSAGSEERPTLQSPGVELFRDYTPPEFRALEAAQRDIDIQNFRDELLSAAIFHETNARRLEQKLPALALQPQVRAASLKHAQLMGAGRFLSHGTPNQPQNTTPHDRLVKEGLQPGFSAENIALNFVLRIEPGKPFYTREENGRTIYSYEVKGAPLVPHTYLSLAEAFLAQWMNSPLHRKNLLAIEAQSCGVGCALSKDAKGFDTVYANQNFFAPQAVPGGQSSLDDCVPINLPPPVYLTLTASTHPALLKHLARHEEAVERPYLVSESLLGSGPTASGARRHAWRRAECIRQ